MLNFLKHLFLPFPKEYENYPINKLVLQIFERAKQENATDILFGVPPGEVYDREENKTFSQVPDEELKVFAKTQELDIKEPEPFEMSSVPIFMKIDSKWNLVLDIPMCLHTECIDNIQSFSTDYSTTTMDITISLEDSVATFKFDTNENFNYLASDITFDSI